jgi:phosphotriesterase-related protein
MEQLDIVEKAGYTAGRFISIHTQAEEDFAMHLAVARRGAWIEYDGIGGWGEDATYVENIHRVLDAGLGSRLLLSHDRGWYDPALPGGGTPKPYTYLFDVFLPKLAASGVDAATIDVLVRDNPFRAFAR